MTFGEEQCCAQLIKKYFSQQSVVFLLLAYHKGLGNNLGKKTFSQNRPSLRQQSENYIFLTKVTKVKFEFAAIDNNIRRHKLESFELTFN